MHFILPLIHGILIITICVSKATTKNYKKGICMCGLGGYFNLGQRSFSCNQQLLEKMQKTLEHRGPNGYRIWISDEDQLALFHRRLSIMDLSDAGFQPMFDAERTVAVMCNGEIYNHPLLRKKLEALGYAYQSHSDTETIVYAYKEWGIKALDYLEGMFAIVLYDFRTQELYLVRDRIGIKPLYFSLQGDVISFASEIKALWQLPWIFKEVNSQALSHYLTFLATPAPMTLYKNIYKLPAAYYVKVDADKNVTFHNWYTFLKPTVTYDLKQLSDETFCVKKIRAMLRDSIEQQMMSDVPYGVFLSGGIDSSLNVALMSEVVDQVKTYNVSFADGQEYSELAWARKIARRFNTDHHEVIISEKEAFEFFQKMVYHQDEPLADCVCIPLYYVSKLLKDSGVTVVQVGEGSDELFCGYAAYGVYIDAYNRYWKNSQRFIPAFAKQGIYNAAATVFPEKFNRLDMLKNWADGKNIFWGGATAFSELWKQKLLRQNQSDFEVDPVIEKIHPGLKQIDSSYTVIDYHLHELHKVQPDVDFYTSMAYLEFKQRLPELLLMRVDKMTMATSVEARVPFLDHNLVEFAFQIPTSLKYKNGVTKYILKKAAEGILPYDTIYRKKMGFAAPAGRWFKQGAYFKQHFLDTVHSKTVWSDYFDTQEIDKLFARNQNSISDFSVQLWVLQNLLAVEL